MSNFKSIGQGVRGYGSPKSGVSHWVWMSLLQQCYALTCYTVKISLVCPRDEIPADSIKGKMMNVYAEYGQCTLEKSIAAGNWTFWQRDSVAWFACGSCMQPARLGQWRTLINTPATLRPYNLYCVGGDVKPCSINQSISYAVLAHAAARPVLLVHCVQKKTPTHIFFHISMNYLWI